jgi:CheY-like chemotaxis protein
LPPSARVSRRVVVIDDNVQGANAMRRLVKAFGGDCRVAHDGEAGVEQVLAFQPEVVFVDIGMPGIDGYETCRRIRASVGVGVIVVALTGWGRVRDKHAAALAGFDVHLTKPADPAALELLLTDPDPRVRLAARPLEAR